MESSKVSSDQMPNLQKRRLVRLYAYPWAQIAVGALLAIWSLLDGVSPIYVAVWSPIVAACLIVQDLGMRSSRLRAARNKLREMRDKPAGPPPELADVDELYSRSPVPSWSTQPLGRQWWVAMVLLLASWAYAMVIGLGTDVDNTTLRLALVIWVMLFPLPSLSVTLMANMAQKRVLGNEFIWVLCVAAGVVTYWTVGTMALQPVDRLIIGALVGITYFSAYTARRLWAGETAYYVALNGISLALLDESDMSRIEEKVVELVRTHFRYDRVYLLKPLPNKEALHITYASGEYQNVLGYEAAYDNSITGRAFRGRPIAWNDVGLCSYYLTVPSLRDTRAEIAVPVMHQGEVFAVLDVQSTVANVFGPTDTRTLETIGRMLGAAMATNRNQELIRDVRQMWADLDEMSQINLTDEHEVFEMFAEFARKQFRAEPVVYFPLSLTGRPVQKPMTMGLYDEEAISLPLDDEDSSLIRLIDGWKTQYFTHIDDESIVTQHTPPGKRGFVVREGVRSACFVPIGPRDGRLGALFLNFRMPREFNDMFQFTVESFAQTMSELTSTLRYRTMYTDSFGRPELNIHQLLNRNDLKVDGIRRKAENAFKIQEGGDRANSHTLRECPLASLVDEMDTAFREISVAEAAVPPSFWGGVGLEYELIKFQGELANSYKNAPPVRVSYQIDRPIEQETPLVRLALFRVITEAITNAIVHAKASEIAVVVSRLPMTIHVEISNDGKSLSKNAPKGQGKRGIYWLLAECKKQMEASDHGTPETRGDHTVVELSIPALPWNPGST